MHTTKSPRTELGAESDFYRSKLSSSEGTDWNFVPKYNRFYIMKTSLGSQDADLKRLFTCIFLSKIVIVSS